MLDVVCVGEALVDFLPGAAGQRVRDVETWHRCVGGAPANVSVALARLGARSALLGVVGEDEFGHFLREALQREGVEVSHLRQTPEGKTGLAFVSLTATGERSFTFYRTRSAEQLLGAQDVDGPFVAAARAVHCGSNSLLRPEARQAMLQLVGAARAAGRLVSCDPNLRLHLWPDPSELQAVLAQLLPLCSVVKLAEDELPFVTGRDSPEAGLAHLASLGVALPVVTLAERGALLLWRGQLHRVAAPRVQVVDATGAGDGFMGGLLFGLTRLCSGHAQLLALEGARLEALAAFACTVASRVVGRLGAVAGLPHWAEVAELAPPALR